MRNLFIVLEGIDGSGSSTQAELLKTHFLQNGEKARLSPEPSEGPIGKLIRQAMQTDIISMPTPELFDRQMAYLFAADRYYHLFNRVDGVFKLIEQDQTHVITTRYYFSSLAYNCDDPEQYHFVQGLNAHFPTPDWVIYLDIPVDVSLQRLTQRNIREVYETKDKLTRVKQNFDRIFADYSGKLLKLDGTKPIRELHQTIVNSLPQID